MPQRDSFDSLNPRPFIRALSYREFLTPLCLSLLFTALIKSLAYLLHSSSNWVTLVLFCLFMILNHVFYKAEHLRSNNFIGRNLHDYIFLLAFSLLMGLFRIVKGQSFSLDIGHSVLALFTLVFMTMIFEGLVSLCRRGLNLLGWRIL